MVLIYHCTLQKRVQRYKKDFISANLRDEKWAVCQFVPNFRQFIPHTKKTKRAQLFVKSF